MGQRLAVLFCLVFSGFSALVYQLVWTRLLGFAFGTTTEAIATVLGVFFGGLALGNLWAAKGLKRVKRPLRAYGILEIGIGAFALAILEPLKHFDGIYGIVGVDHSALAMTALRVVAAAAVLLPPTIAMGATMPLVVRGTVREDASLGRWSAWLYTANTFGAVLGAYLCGYWLIPYLGLSTTVLAAGIVNLVVGSAIIVLAGRRAPVATHETPAAETRAPAAQGRGFFLACFAVSGFVAIGYEIVWSKVFGIVMEGTLYGFAAVLSAYLLGLALGSLCIAPYVDRIRDLPRAFGLLHITIAAAVAAGMGAVPFLPYAYAKLGQTATGADAVHLLFLLVVPLVVFPTALFGAAFPILIRIYAQRADQAGEGFGVATAVNTLGSILASFSVGFWAVPKLGIDATLYLLILIDLVVAQFILFRFQWSTGTERLKATALGAVVTLGVAFAFNGVHVGAAVSGRGMSASTFAAYRQKLFVNESTLAYLNEGRASVVSVHSTPLMRRLRTNGMPESGFHYAPPYYSSEAVLLGTLPYLFSDDPKRALVIGLGGGNTLDAVRATGVETIDVIELEQVVVDASEIMYGGRDNPLDDPRVTLHVNDARNELLLERHRDTAGFDMIASQPSHPWLIGAASLFTEEFFQLVRDNLNPGGVFALWVNGFRTDAESLLAVAASFERAFPGAVLLNSGSQDPYSSLLFLGTRTPFVANTRVVEQRLEEPGVRRMLGLFQLDALPALFSLFEGPVAAFAELATIANSDDNAFVEMRTPRKLRWDPLDFRTIESRLGATTPILPTTSEPLDIRAIAERMLRAPGEHGTWRYAAKLDRLLRAHGDPLDPVTRKTFEYEAATRNADAREQAEADLRQLAADHPERPEPWRALARHLRAHEKDLSRAGRAFVEAFDREGNANDAFDAARAFYPTDPELAWRWFDRIPAKDRQTFPSLAFFEAERALSARTSAADIRTRYQALVEFRDTGEGRVFPEIHRLLTRMAFATGDLEGARTYGDIDYRAREIDGSRWIRTAELAMKKREFDKANAALDRARSLLPNDPRISALAAEIDLQSEDPAQLALHLRELRRWTPRLEAAIATENYLRTLHKLPLLPERSIEELTAIGVPDGNPE